MSDAGDEIFELLHRASTGEDGAHERLLTHYRPRLKKMVRLRLSRLLQGRVDESDIVQEASLEAANRLDDYLASRPLPFYLWLREIAGRKLIDAQRRQLGAASATLPGRYRCTTGISPRPIPRRSRPTFWESSRRLRKRRPGRKRG